MRGRTISIWTMRLQLMLRRIYSGRIDAWDITDIEKEDLTLGILK